MKLARTIHFDASDQNIFARPAESGEWAISGGFEFSNWTDGDLVGKARQAFSNGWLSLDSFGRATLVAVAQIEDGELTALTDRLADHLPWRNVELRDHQIRREHRGTERVGAVGRA